MRNPMSWDEIQAAHIADPSRIVFVNLDDEVIYATDEEGHELLKLGIRVLDRRTRKRMTVTIQFPCFDELDEFRNECLEWFFEISAYAPTAVAVDNMEDLTEEGAYDLWRRVTGALLSFKPARDKGMHIFFRYLAPYVEEIDGIDPADLEGIAARKGVEVPTRSIEKSDLWLRGNICAKTGMQMMVAILCVNDYIKKNAVSLLQKIFHWAILQPSEVQSQKPKAHPPMQLDGSPRLKSGFGFAD